MATRYEYYITGDDTANPTWTKYWKGQTFTPSVSHTIVFVRLKLHRNGNPGQLTVSIRATSGGNPIGADLCSGTYDSSTLPADGWRNAEWVGITLGAGSPLTAETMYAIIIRIPDGDASNSVLWNTDQTFPTYTRGTKVSSTTFGVTWVAPAPGEDLLFEEWDGIPPTFIPRIMIF